MEQKVTTGTITVEAHYDAKKNVTRIKKKVSSGEDDETKETFLGLRILKLVTEKGVVKVEY